VKQTNYWNLVCLFSTKTTTKEYCFFLLDNFYPKQKKQTEVLKDRKIKKFKNFEKNLTDGLEESKTFLNHM